MRPVVIRDLRQKEKFIIDDFYLNGYARHLGVSTTAIYVSLCRHANKEQQSFPSIRLLAEEHSISTKTAQRAIKKLEALNIIHYERTRNSTGKWLNNTYFLQDKSVWKRPTGHQRPMVQPQDISALTTGHYDPTKETHKKETHITPLYSPLKKYSSLKDINEEDLIEISQRYKIPLGFVKLQLEKMTNWLEAKGRKYKNNKRGLMNWVLREAEEKMDKQKKGGFVDASQI